MHIFVFIDDDLGMAKMEVESPVFSNMVRSDLAWLGLLEQASGDAKLMFIICKVGGPPKISGSEK